MTSDMAVGTIWGEDEQEQQRVGAGAATILEADLAEAQHLLVQQGAEAGERQLGRHRLDAPGRRGEKDSGTVVHT